MKCKYCCAEYRLETYSEFCSKTCTNKYHRAVHRDGKEGFTFIKFEKYDIGINDEGYWIFSKKDDRPSIGTFKTLCEAREFAEKRVSDDTDATS